MRTKHTLEEIPKGWQYWKLKQLLTFVVDNRGKTPPISNEGIPLIEVNAVGEKNIKYSEISKFVSPETYKNWFRKHLEKNDVLFSTVGRTASCSIYGGDIRSVIAQNIIGLRFGNDNPIFMYYLLTQNKNNQEFKNIEMSAAQPSVKVSQMIHLKFLTPPYSEQNRIVAVLETWDRAIEKLENKIQIKKKISRGLMQKLLTGRARLPGFTGRWETYLLSQIGNFSKGEGILKDQVTEVGLNVIRYGELYTKYSYKIRKIYSHIPLSLVSQTKEIRYGDILFAGSGETIDEIGKSAVYLLKEKCYAGGDLIIFTPKISDGLFLSYLLNTGESRKKLREFGQGQAIVHIHRGDLEKVSLQIPSLNEQKMIAKVIDTAENEISKLEEKRFFLNVQKKYLLNNLITGAIRTPENLKIH